MELDRGGLRSVQEWSLRSSQWLRVAGAATMQLYQSHALGRHDWRFSSFCKMQHAQPLFVLDDLSRICINSNISNLKKTMKNFRLTIRTARWFPVGSALLTLSLTACVASKNAQAQAANAVWKRLEKADSHITGSQVTWLVTRTVSPSPLTERDIEKLVASTKKDSEARHLDDAQTQAVIKKFVAAFEQNAKGTTHIGTLAFLHQGQTTRCDVFTQSKAYFAIDYYDGTNIVSLTGFDKHPNPGVRPTQGTLVRAEQSLPYSAVRPGDLLFMVGQPVTDVFRPEDSKVQQNSDGSITLEKPQKIQQLDFLLRLHLSKEGMHPISMECIQKGSSRLLLRWSIGSYKQRDGGVDFPEDFKVEAFNKAQQVSVTEDYKLIKGAFNQAADLTELRVPSGSIIDDFRFGRPHVASYRINTKGLLPSDEKVRDFLAQQGRPLNAAVGQPNATPTSADPQQTSTNSLAPTNTYSVTPLALGALLFLTGCSLWVRSGTSKHDRS